MGRRINTIMQTCFFGLMEQVTGEPLLPKEEAIAEIKAAISKTYGKRGEQIVQANFAAVDAALAHMHEVLVPDEASSTFERPPVVPSYAPDFIKSVTAEIIGGHGDLLPVSALPIDGTYPTGNNKVGKTEYRH